MPASLMWLCGHIFLVLVGMLIMTTEGQKLLGAAVGLSLGSSLLATGIAGLVLYLYVRSTDTLQDKLKILSDTGITSVFQHRSIRIREEYDHRLRNATRIDLIGYGLSAFRIDDLASHLEIEPEGRLQESELHRSVRALHKIARAATCDEIAEVTAEQGPRVRKYNNNRVLKSVPEFATRVKKPGQLLKYRLSSRGAALLELLDLGFQDVALRRPRAPGRSTPSPKAYRRNAADRHSADGIKK